MKKLQPRVRIILEERKEGDYDRERVEEVLKRAARTKEGREVLEKWRERL